MNKMINATFMFLLFGASQALAGVAPVETQEQAAKVQYKAGKDVNFEELLIQGQLKRPEVSVVTGNVHQGDDGLLRLRENFLDRVATDSGEEAQQ